MKDEHYNQRLERDTLGYVFTKFKSGLSGKVDKVKGKGLSTCDYSQEDKAKVDGLRTATFKQIDELFQKG